MIDTPQYLLDAVEDAKQLAAFRSTPPAFLLVSAKRKSTSK